MQGLLHLGLVLAAYGCGATPFAFLIARAHGIDIRAVGSGNVGATNVFRSVGRTWGVATFLLDAAKGYLPALLLPKAAVALGLPAAEGYGLLYGAAAIAGHTWPVWLRFKGGKGVATSAGVLLAVAPPVVAAALAAWALLYAIGRFVSLASIGAAVAAAAAGWALYPARDARPAVLTLFAGLIMIRHRANIGRLLRGTEPRTGAARRTSNP